MSSFIALLRGINVSGRNKVPMGELRSLCADLGWDDVQTYIQSGNVVFHASAAPIRLESDLERAIESRFGFSIPVIVRSAVDWAAYVEGNPFLAESQIEPARVMLALSKAEPDPRAADRLRERAASGERISQVGNAIWIYYADGVARSKLAPSLLDRLAGSPVTTRNWRTVGKLGELVRCFTS